MPKEFIAYLVLLLLIILFLLPNIKIVKEHEHLLIERLGSFLKIIDQPGVYILAPLFDRVIERETILPQTRIIKGDKTSLSYSYKITDLKMYGYYALDPIRDLEICLSSEWKKELTNLDVIKESIKDRGIELIDIKEVINNNF
ncbi:MAG: hypothetical protein C4537_03210 [Acholeplasma sp.]|nr:MAG: hypothetical protein C4537_03210 [Acholeplasma sp.]